MVGNLLLRGMLVGVFAGLLAFGFARIFDEPQVDRAIAFEDQLSQAKGEVPEPELVSRETQAGLGLFTGVIVYSAAVGGLFSLVFAFVYGRVGRLGPRATAALLALGGFVAIALVPDLKYPANPPSVGNPETIGLRTELFFVMLVVSVAALVLAVTLARRLSARYGAWNATIIAGVAFVVVIAIVQYVLPEINEVPEQFSAVVLWRFRVAALGIQVVLWTTIGLLFGVLAELSFAERFRQRLPVGNLARGQSHRWRRLSVCLLLDAGCAAFSGNLAQAQDAIGKAIGSAPAPENEQLPSELQPTIASSIPVLAQLKKDLFDLGYNLQWTYFADGLSNPSGGVKQGAAYEGLLYMVLDADLAKIAGLDGLSFRVNAYQIHGRQLSATNVFNLTRVDSIEARPATRLFELWVEQKLGDLASIRVGQLAADNQFFISEFGNTLYVSNTFGWPQIFGSDLPGGGGPNYPLATPGVRLKVTPNNQLALLAGLYNGDPAGTGFTGTEQIKNPAGLNFRLQDPPLLMAETQYKYNQDKTAEGLAGTIKLGGWHHFGKFDDEHFDVDGKSLADPSSNGLARTHSGNYGVYGVIDQMLWRLPGSDPKKGVGAFARASWSPSDRNLIDFYAEAGVNFMGLWDKRPDDSFGLAAAFLQLSPGLRGLDLEKAFFEKTALPLRDYELVVELTYQAQIVAGWTIQPDFQYIFHPGGGVVDPLNPFVGRIPDAAVFVLRTAISF